MKVNLERICPFQGETPVGIANNGYMSPTNIRLGLVEDHKLYREILAESLDGIDGLEVVVTSPSFSEAKFTLAQAEIDCAILDIELGDGNGVNLGLLLRETNPNLAIVLLSGRDMVELLLGIPQLQRRGWSYLSKTSTTSLDILVKTIRKTVTGQIVIDPALVERSSARPGTPVSALTKRQYEILRAVASGQSNQTIADNLGIANNSVVNHLSAIYAALNVPEGQNARVSAVLEFLNDTARLP